MGGTLISVLFIFALIHASESATVPVGVFTTQEMWNKSNARIAANKQPYYNLYTQTLSRANLNAIPTPFHMDNMTRPVSEGGIYFGWTSGGVNTLNEAVNKLQDAGVILQAYALAYTWTKDVKYAKKLVDYMYVWAKQHTPVNMYDFHINFATGTFDGMFGSNFQTDRPWNFALDAIWQTYGLMGISDSYLLLKKSGYPISAANETLFKDWIKSVASATNSGFHAWTRWADAHTKSSAFLRYRSDNHLSWAQTGLIAAGAALGDAKLINYTLYGDAWQDIKAPLYSNPSHFREMISRAIQPGSGIVYEQIIGRTPLIGYSFFHINALMLIATIGEIHTGQNLFGYVGRNGSSLKLAYDTYSPYPLGLKNSTDPAEARTNFVNSYGWLYEQAYNHWPTDTNFSQIVARNSRGNYILQGPGPWSIFWAQDLPS